MWTKEGRMGNWEFIAENQRPPNLPNRFAQFKEHKC